MRRGLLALPLAPILALGAACERGGEAAPPPGAPPAAPVTVAPAVEKPVPIEVRAIGTVTPSSTVSVTAQVDGELVAVLIADGAEVREGQLLFRLDPRPFKAAVAQAEAVRARDQAQAANARTQERRYRDLAAKKFVSSEQADQQRTAAEAAEAAVEADEAAVRAAKVQLGYTEIRAPIDGRAGRVLVNQGNVVKAKGDPLVVLNRLRPIYADFAVPEAELAPIREHLRRGPLEVEASVGTPPLARARGRLVFIDNQVNPQTGTVLLRAEFANADEALWPGQFLDVVLTLAETPAVVVPTRAVGRGQQGSYVWVVQADGTVENRPVTVARESGEDSAIAKGVAPGERVVTDGQQGLTPGAHVRVAGGASP